jgi:hypothetical protein
MIATIKYLLGVTGDRLRLDPLNLIEFALAKGKLF